MQRKAAFEIIAPVRVACSSARASRDVHFIQIADMFIHALTAETIARIADDYWTIIAATPSLARLGQCGVKSIEARRTTACCWSPGAT